ncbi:hypothetical protein ACWEMN_14245, partial [Streptomyces mirabilis]
ENTGVTTISPSASVTASRAADRARPGKPLVKAACLRRVWEYQEFSRWFAELLHGPSSGDPFRAGSARARLRRILGSPAAAGTFAESYIGKVTGPMAMTTP